MATDPRVSNEGLPDGKGLRKLAEGREAEMFAWEGGQILRLLRDPDGQGSNALQAAAMEAARSRGVRVPAVYGTTTVMDRPGIIMERIAGTDLLTLIGKRPWMVFGAGRISGEMHARLHEAAAPESLPPLRAVLEWRIRSVVDLPEDLRQFALEALDGLPDGDRICHGDFHPANIMMDGQTPVLIDWSNVTRGDPAADVARARLILGLGSPPPGTSTTLRVMALVGRRLLIWLYLRSYRRVRSLDMRAVERWQVPVAAARLAEGIQEETAAVMRYLEDARRNANA